MKSWYEVKKAIAILKENGYFVDNLWTVNDVKDAFECTDEDAQTILYASLTNEYIMGEIQFSIHSNAKDMGCVEKIAN